MPERSKRYATSGSVFGCDLFPKFQLSATKVWGRSPAVAMNRCFGSYGFVVQGGRVRFLKRVGWFTVRREYRSRGSSDFFSLANSGKAEKMSATD